jgi:hypothetical protein
MSKLLTPLSLFALAAAVALHAVAPAVAADDDEVASTAKLPPRVSCKMIRLGTTREVEKLLEEMREAGHANVGAVRDMICGW